MISRRGGALIAVLLVALVPAPASPKESPAPPSVIAITEAGGFNVLHEDYRFAPGADRALPAGVPDFERVSLPRGRDFAGALAEAEGGTLGHLQPGRLYYVDGTRIFIYLPDDAPQTDVFADPGHGTGTTSAAVGLQHGTSPDSFLVYVPTASQAGWSWLSHQDWIDVVSTSYYDVVNRAGRCHAAAFVRKTVRRGHLVFSAAGNAEEAGALSSPAGTAAAYQVGGVDSQGRPYVPGAGGAEPSVTSTRPYETGDRFDFPAASPSSFSGDADFGGTSGATPSTAGRAADLIRFARGLLGDRRAGVHSRSLAIASPATRPPARGPLSDGRLTGPELSRVLHHVAVPALPQPGTRYLVEGYGALDDQTVAAAKGVLAGTVAEPARPEDDQMNDQVEAQRAAIAEASDC